MSKVSLCPICDSVLSTPAAYLNAIGKIRKEVEAFRPAIISDFILNEYRKEYEPVKTVYIIQRFWHDPYVSLFESSMGYKDVGECATEEEAKRIVKFGGLRYIDSVEYSFFRYHKKEK